MSRAPEPASEPLAALVLALPARREPVVAGLRLGERARRVAVHAGVPAERVTVVRSPEELDAIAPALAGAPLLLLSALGQVVAPALVEPLDLEEPGTRIAVDGEGRYAGAARLSAAAAASALPALKATLASGGAAGAEPPAVPGAEKVAAGARARHPARTRAELRAARAWQWELVHKPLDAILTARLWRPLSRPLTRIFLRLPFSPNAISVASVVFSIAGGVIAASASYGLHVLGFGIYFLGALLDNVDGEVARLRLETSSVGGWLDTIGDDVARFAVLIGVFFHVSHHHPDLPIEWLAAVTIANTVIANALLYWWCVFVGKTYNNQEFASEIGAAPHLGSGGRSLGRVVADLGAQAARRDFLDAGVIVLAIVGLSEVSMLGLAIGQAIGLLIIVRVHLRIVAQRRQVQQG